jgi:hypothetical protein
MWLNDDLELSEDSETSSVMSKEDDIVNLNQSRKKMFDQRKKRLSWCVRSYIFLRETLVNPIILINDRERIKSIVEATKKGGTVILSSIEMAIIKDIEHEMVFGKTSE